MIPAIKILFKVLYHIFGNPTLPLNLIYNRNFLGDLYILLLEEVNATINAKKEKNKLF